MLAAAIFLTMLALDGGSPALNKAVSYPWPKVDKEVEESVITHLHTALSDYARTGITKKFEDKFKEIHKSPYALVTSSGTAALHSAFYALQFGPGDEVIVPDYTFFATAMPLFQLGTLPVLADSDKHGSISPAAIEKLITKKTKGIVVTHMWGNPCNMEEILRISKKNKLYVVEDCSHAHGAKYKNQLVGTFGDIGIWSLQTKKIISAGEGGVMVFKNKVLYDRAQLLGHFNKRALQEIDKNSSDYQFAFTGTGLKYRAHPLGLAVAITQLPKLENWINNKQINAKKIQDIVLSVPGIYLLHPDNDGSQNAYYAFCFIVDKKLCGFTRKQLVDAMVAEGFKDIDMPQSTVGLHRFKIFQKPISPVYKYSTNGIRDGYRNSDYISDHIVKISVPVEEFNDPEDPTARNFLQAFEICWNKVTRVLIDKKNIS